MAEAAGVAAGDEVLVQLVQTECSAPNGHAQDQKACGVCKDRDIFPDALLHVGGDEVATDCWLDNPDVVAFMKAKGLADGAALQSWFCLLYTSPSPRDS